MTFRRSLALTALTVLILAVLAACGDSDDTASSSLSASPTTVDAPPATSSGAETTSAASTSAPSTSAPEAPVTTATPSTAAPTTAAPTTAPPTTLPGEEFDFGPQAGDVLAVVGVQHDDVLNVRHIPGLDGEIIATLAPHADGVVAEGRTRFLPQSIWYQVTVGGTTGWASASFLGVLGVTDDATAEIVDLAGDTPIAETLIDLADDIAALVASDEPPSRIRISAGPLFGDLGEVTVDVVGLGDDALLGWRLHIFATEHESGEAWVLKTVERTALCGRGVTDDGLCV